MHRRWEVFRGASTEEKDLLFTAKKSSMIQFKTELDIFLAANTAQSVPDFKVKGSWMERSCTIYLGDSNTIIAQVSFKLKWVFKKENTNGLMTHLVFIFFYFCVPTLSVLYNAHVFTCCTKTLH